MKERERIVKKVACAKDNSFLLLQTGELYTWRRGNVELVDPFGVYFATHSWNPTFQRFNFHAHRHKVIDVVCGISHFVALTDQALWNLYVWGDNSKGQLGLDPVSSATISYQSTPRRLVNTEFRSAFVEVQCGDSFTVALDEDGTHFYWGERELQKGSMMSASSSGDAFDSDNVQRMTDETQVLREVFKEIQRVNPSSTTSLREQVRVAVTGMKAKVQLPTVLTPRLVPDARIHVAQLFISYFRQHYYRADTFHHVATAFDMLSRLPHIPVPEFFRQQSTRAAIGVLVGQSSISNQSKEQSVFPVFFPPGAYQGKSPGGSVRNLQEYIAALLFFTNQYSSLVPTQLLQLFLPSDARLDEAAMQVDEHRKVALRETEKPSSGVDPQSLGNGEERSEHVDALHVTQTGPGLNENTDPHEEAFMGETLLGGKSTPATRSSDSARADCLPAGLALSDVSSDALPPTVNYDFSLPIDNIRQERGERRQGAHGNITAKSLELNINAPVDEMWDRIDAYLARMYSTTGRRSDQGFSSGRFSRPQSDVPSNILVRQSRRRKLSVFSSAESQPTTSLDFQRLKAARDAEEPPTIRVVQPGIRVVCSGDSIFSFPDFSKVLDAKLQAARDRTVVQLQHESNQLDSRLRHLRRFWSDHDQGDASNDISNLEGFSTEMLDMQSFGERTFPVYAHQDIVLLILLKKQGEAESNIKQCKDHLEHLDKDDAVLESSIRELHAKRDHLVTAILGPKTDHHKWAREMARRMRRCTAPSDGKMNSERGDSTGLLQRIGATLMRRGYSAAAELAQTAARSGAIGAAATGNYVGGNDIQASGRGTIAGFHDQNNLGHKTAAAAAASGGLFGHIVALRAEHQAVDVRSRTCLWCSRAHLGHADMRAGDRVRLYVPLGVPFFNGGYPNDNGLKHAWANPESKLWQAVKFLTQKLGMTVQDVREAMIKNSLIGLAYPSDVPSIMDAMLRSTGSYSSVNLVSNRLQMYSHIGDLEGATTSDEILTILTAQSTSPDFASFVDASGRTRSVRVPYTVEEGIITKVEEVKALKEKGLPFRRYTVETGSEGQRANRRVRNSNQSARSSQHKVYHNLPQQHLELVNPSVTACQQRHATIVARENELAEKLLQLSSIRDEYLQKEKLRSVLALRKRWSRIRQINEQSKVDLLSRLLASYSQKV